MRSELPDCTLRAYEVGNCQIVHREHGRLGTARLYIESMGGWELPDCTVVSREGGGKGPWAVHITLCSDRGVGEYL